MMEDAGTLGRIRLEGSDALVGLVDREPGDDSSLWRNLVNSSYGRAFVSIRDDETAAMAMGVDTTYYKVLAFVMSLKSKGSAAGLHRNPNPTPAGV